MMAKTRTASADRANEPSRPNQPTEPKGLTMFSIRFTEEQRDLLQRAADLKGWSPTQLLRAAALDRAVHILNTGTRTNLDFLGLAAEVARTLCAYRRAWCYRDGERQEADVIEDPSELGEPSVERPVEVEPRQLGVDGLRRLEQAARLGGVEFLQMLIDACVSANAPTRADLPAPIDPSKLSE